VPLMRPTISAICASACSAVILPFSDARGGDRLGDLAAHRPGAHDGGFEHEHFSSILSCGWIREPIDSVPGPL